MPLKLATGKSLDQLESTELFEPLRTTDVECYKHPQNGNPIRRTGPSSAARNMAKGGQLVLQRRTWNGKQVSRGLCRFGGDSAEECV
jgi:hypothetical protein